MDSLELPNMEVSQTNAIELNLKGDAMCADCGITYFRESFEIKTSFGWHVTAARCKPCAEERGFETRNA